eukprot:4346877-Pyramimonas_sp.AAC.1
MGGHAARGRLLGPGGGRSHPRCPTSRASPSPRAEHDLEESHDVRPSGYVPEDDPEEARAGRRPGECT